MIRPQKLHGLAHMNGWNRTIRLWAIAGVGGAEPSSTIPSVLRCCRVDAGAESWPGRRASADGCQGVAGSGVGVSRAADSANLSNSGRFTTIGSVPERVTAQTVGLLADALISWCTVCAGMKTKSPGPPSTACSRCSPHRYLAMHVAGLRKGRASDVLSFVNDLQSMRRRYFRQPAGSGASRGGRCRRSSWSPHRRGRAPTGHRARPRRVLP